MQNKINPNQHTILVVDDDIYITEMIQLYLVKKGFHVLSAHNGIEALNLIQSHNIHCMILDIMLPHMDGWQVCEKARQKSDIPILMLSAKGESEDKVQGLTLGADDYLVKPFDPNELIARVISLLRRANFQTDSTTTIEMGSLRIDVVGRTVMIGIEYIDLTPREYQLLLVLVKHPNHVFNRQHLLDLVWGEDYMGEDRVVDVFVTRLRHKLSTDEEIWKIETVRGIGYKFTMELSQ
ncbi:response regulator transcription factor [Peribacillus acanthi]|uniref:response regulator transcription factor n=1 Tax=Peribacillus acanthi TaxID=2171554 RepID=UPI000D3E942C|nr:response regulator transcription factor [Peribacillus acanthi]